MQARELLDKTQNLLYDIQEKNMLDEVENIIFSLEPTDLPLYKEICELFNFEIGEKDRVVVDQNSVLNLCAITLLHSKYINNGISYPIFLISTEKI